jgi:hypothetical protein
MERVLDYTLFRPLICPFLAPRSLHACALVRRDWSAILVEHTLWHRWCRMLPPSPFPAPAATGGFALFSHLRRVRCSVSVPLRLENSDDTTILELACCCCIPRHQCAHNCGTFMVMLRDEAEALVNLGGNWDTMTRLFRRTEGKLRNELQTNLSEVLLDEDALRTFGRILPSHDYQVAAFPVQPRLVDAATGFADLANLVAADPHPQSLGRGWTSVYRHRLEERATHCATHLVLAPLHDVHDMGAVRMYEAQLMEGHRPVVLALCAGLPYNSRIHSGMEVNALTGYTWHDREIANLRAILRRAESAAAGGQLAQAAAAALRETLAEYASGMHHEQPSAQQQVDERRRALDCQAFNHSSRDDYLRLGLCLILDGHHKMRAAANLGAAVTVLCYGLQGTAVTYLNVPSEFNGEIDNLYFDSEAIFEAIAHAP